MGAQTPSFARTWPWVLPVWCGQGSMLVYMLFRFSQCRPVRSHAAQLVCNQTKGAHVVKVRCWFTCYFFLVNAGRSDLMLPNLSGTRPRGPRLRIHMVCKWWSTGETAGKHMTPSFTRTRDLNANDLNQNKRARGLMWSKIGAGLQASSFQSMQVSQVSCCPTCLEPDHEAQDCTIGHPALFL